MTRTNPSRVVFTVFALVVTAAAIALSASFIFPATAQAADCGKDAYEPDDTPEAATFYTLGPDSTQNHTMHSHNREGCIFTPDKDFVYVDAQAGSRYVADINWPQRSGTTDACDIQTIALGHYPTPYVANGDTWNWAQRCSARDLVYVTQESGPWYVYARDALPDTNQNYSDHSLSYTFNVKLEKACADSYESDNTKATARTIAPGDLQDHAFCTRYDYDWVSIPVEAGNSYTLTATDTTFRDVESVPEMGL